MTKIRWQWPQYKNVERQISIWTDSVYAKFLSNKF